MKNRENPAADGGWLAHWRDELLFAARAAGFGLLIALLAHLLLRDADSGPARPAVVVQQVAAPAGAPAAAAAAPRESYRDAVRAAAPAVVNVFTAQHRRGTAPSGEPLFGQLFDDPGIGPQSRTITNLGSGVLVSSDGYLLTNAHVIAGADEIRVTLPGGEEYPAALVGSDEESDLAVLKIDASELPSMRFAADDQLHVGDVVLAIGNPFGVGQAVTMGIVSGTGRDQLGINTFENFIQTDAAINPGNSGGALVNPRGELVGISTAIFGTERGAQGIGFAIPAALAREVFAQLVQHGRVIRGWLGVRVHGLDGVPRAVEAGIEGVLISGVFADSPAQRAGLVAGDIITHIDDMPLGNTQTLLRATTARSPGSQVLLRGLRKGQPFEALATLRQRPQATRR